MSHIPNEAEKIVVDGATVDFYKVVQDGQSRYYFDSSKMEPPHPMVNAMACIGAIKGTKDTLVMINHKSPGGLFAKLEDDVKHISQDLDDGLVKVVFSYNATASGESDLTQTSCEG